LKYRHITQGVRISIGMFIINLKASFLQIFVNPCNLLFTFAVATLKDPDDIPLSEEEEERQLGDREVFVEV
jgi:hypothetical protein